MLLCFFDSLLNVWKKLTCILDESLEDNGRKASNGGDKSVAGPEGLTQVESPRHRDTNAV